MHTITILLCASAASCGAAHDESSLLQFKEFAAQNKAQMKVRSDKQPVGTQIFRKEVPFQIMMQGSINGMPFTVMGKGLGDASVGQAKGKYVCTSGKLPIAWSALAPILGEVKVFSRLPNGLSPFFQDSLPEGYTQEDVLNFQDDGTLKAYHEVMFSNGVLVSKVTVVGEGFKSGSLLLKAGSLKPPLPISESVSPYEDGVKSLSHLVFPEAASTQFIIATRTTVNRPLGERRYLPMPAPHYMHREIVQFKDSDDSSDHIIQEDRSENKYQ